MSRADERACKHRARSELWNRGLIGSVSSSTHLHIRRSLGDRVITVWKCCCHTQYGRSGLLHRVIRVDRKRALLIRNSRLCKPHKVLDERKLVLKFCAIETSTDACIEFRD